MTARSREPTDRQLADIVRFIARACLEVERGLRPAEHLQRFMDPEAALQARRLLQLGHYQDGPVRPADLGPPHLTRTGGTVLATVATRTQGGRWGALTLHLEQHRGRWQVADLQRLLATAHYRAGRRTRDNPTRAIGPTVRR